MCALFRWKHWLAQSFARKVSARMAFPLLRQAGFDNCPVGFAVVKSLNRVFSQMNIGKTSLSCEYDLSQDQVL